MRNPRAGMGLGWLWVMAVTVVVALPACQRRPGLAPDPSATETATEPEAAGENSGERSQRAMASRRRPAGASCGGRADCTSDQVCVAGTCRYERTSVAGEVLATAARGQAQAGDWTGAMESYDAAFAAFEAEDAPIPPEVACGAAELILRGATNPEQRERGATRADLCFRTTVPGHPARLAVQQAVARLRYEGLEIALFDADQPAEAFFTGEQSRPTSDAVQVEVQMPDLEPRELPSHARVREQLNSEEGHRAIADCFIQDWEMRHESRASGEVGIRFSTRMRDMGSYDVYLPEIAVEPTSAGDDGFEPCLAGALGALFDPDDRSIRGESWTQAVRITASVQ